MSVDDMKRRAAAAALELVEPGMKLGLGTGSTAAFFVEALGAKIAEGLEVIGVPTSEATRQQAESLNIPLTTLDDVPYLDLTVDGADEIDDQLRMIKGGGGALLREKIVANASDRVVIIADNSKFVTQLGAFPLPIEVVRFGIHVSRNMIEVLAGEAGCEGEITLRRGSDGKPFVTDNGNLILDCNFRCDPRSGNARPSAATGAGHGGSRLVPWHWRYRVHCEPEQHDRVGSRRLPRHRGWRVGLTRAPRQDHNCERGAGDGRLRL
jgi:ribose 5-phosphate isomerase A